MDAMVIVTITGLALGLLGTGASIIWYGSALVARVDEILRVMEAHARRMEQLEVIVQEHETDIARLEEHIEPLGRKRSKLT